MQYLVPVVLISFNVAITWFLMDLAFSWMGFEGIRPTNYVDAFCASGAGASCYAYFQFLQKETV